MAPAVAAGPPGAIVLGEDDTPTGERCYILNVPPWMGFGFETVQYWVESNENLTGGIPEGVGTANDLSNRADKSAEGFTSDVDPAPDQVPLKENVIGDPTGLHTDKQDAPNKKWVKKGWAVQDPDTRLTQEEFQATCLGP